MIRSLVIPVLALGALAACQEEAAAPPPPPASMTAEAVGHYCQMDVLEHEGPKAQIHVKGLPEPLWFGQVRDAVAFLRMPEETAEVAAIYVSDMGAAESWDRPGADNWIDAEAAYYVIGAAQAGGMGAPEAVPFSELAAAERWQAVNGGEVVRLREVPDDYVLAPVELSALATKREGSRQ